MRINIVAVLALGIAASCGVTPPVAPEIRVLPTVYVVGGRSVSDATTAAGIATQSKPASVLIHGCVDAPSKMIGDLVAALKAAKQEGIVFAPNSGLRDCAAP